MYCNYLGIFFPKYTSSQKKGASGLLLFLTVGRWKQHRLQQQYLFLSRHWPGFVELHMSTLLKCSLIWSSCSKFKASLLQTFPLVSVTWDYQSGPMQRSHWISISAFSVSSTNDLVQQQDHILPKLPFAAEGPALAFLAIFLFTQILS